MSVHVVAGRPAPAGKAVVNTPTPPGAAAGRGPAGVLAPVAAAVVALAVHLLWPNGQAPSAGWTARLPIWLHPYPVALAALLIGLPLLAALERLWAGRSAGDGPLRRAADRLVPGGRTPGA